MRHLFILLTLAVLLAPACRHKNFDDANSPNGNLAGSLQDQLAAIPFPDGLAAPKGASAADCLWVSGNQAWDHSPMTMAIGATMLVPAGPGQLSWGIWELYPGDFPVDLVRHRVSDASDPGKLWFGLADYGTHAWRWFAAADVGAGVPALGRNVVSPGGGLYLAVAVFDDAGATVERVWIDTEVEEWAAYPLNPFGLSGEIHALAVIDGKPAVLIQDPNSLGNHDLYYYYATSEFPASADWAPTAVEVNYVFPYYSLCLVDHGGKPAFTRVNHLQQLWYFNSTVNPPVSAVSWNSSFIADVNDPRADLAVVGGHAAVAYRDDSAAGGDKIMYARSNHPQPIGPDWSYFTVAETILADQEYSAPGLAAVGENSWVAVYWNDITNVLCFDSSLVALPVTHGDMVLSYIDNPALGGASWPLPINWQGQVSVIYDSVNSVMPLYARPLVPWPAGPEDFSGRHRISHMSADMPAIAARQDQIGIAFRDYRDGSVKYAWFSTDDPVGDGVLDSGADWRVVTVDERQTVGEISLCYMQYGIPLVGYTVAADGLFYLSHVVPTS